MRAHAAHFYAHPRAPLLVRASRTFDAVNDDREGLIARTVEYREPARAPSIFRASRFGG